MVLWIVLRFDSLSLFACSSKFIKLILSSASTGWLPNQGIQIKSGKSVYIENIREASENLTNYRDYQGHIRKIGVFMYSISRLPNAC